MGQKNFYSNSFWIVKMWVKKCGVKRNNGLENIGSKIDFSQKTPRKNDAFTCLCKSFPQILLNGKYCVSNFRPALPSTLGVRVLFSYCLSLLPLHSTALEFDIKSINHLLTLQL